MSREDFFMKRTNIYGVPIALLRSGAVKIVPASQTWIDSVNHRFALRMRGKQRTKQGEEVVYSSEVQVQPGVEAAFKAVQQRRLNRQNLELTQQAIQSRSPKAGFIAPGRQLRSIGAEAMPARSISSGGVGTGQSVPSRAVGGQAIFDSMPAPQSSIRREVRAVLPTSSPPPPPSSSVDVQFLLTYALASDTSIQEYFYIFSSRDRQLRLVVENQFARSPIIWHNPNNSRYFGYEAKIQNLGDGDWLIGEQTAQVRWVDRAYGVVVNGASASPPYTNIFSSLRDADVLSGTHEGYAICRSYTNLGEVFEHNTYSLSQLEALPTRSVYSSEFDDLTYYLVAPESLHAGKDAANAIWVDGGVWLDAPNYDLPIFFQPEIYYQSTVAHTASWRRRMGGDHYMDYSYSANRAGQTESGTLRLGTTLWSQGQRYSEFSASSSLSSTWSAGGPFVRTSEDPRVYLPTSFTGVGNDSDCLRTYTDGSNSWYTVYAGDYQASYDLSWPSLLLPGISELESRNHSHALSGYVYIGGDRSYSGGSLVCADIPRWQVYTSTGSTTSGFLQKWDLQAVSPDLSLAFARRFLSDSNSYSCWIYRADGIKAECYQPLGIRGQLSDLLFVNGLEDRHLFTVGETVTLTQRGSSPMYLTSKDSPIASELLGLQVSIFQSFENSEDFYQGVEYIATVLDYSDASDATNFQVSSITLKIERTGKEYWIYADSTPFGTIVAHLPGSFSAPTYNSGAGLSVLSYAGTPEQFTLQANPDRLLACFYTKFSNRIYYTVEAFSLSLDSVLQRWTATEIGDAFLSEKIDLSGQIPDSVLSILHDSSASPYSY